MLGFITISKDGKDPEDTRYHCARCGAFLTDGASRVNINGADQHSYVNPSGIRCNFMTFIDAENVAASEEMFTEHTWFPGYGWRFLACGQCYAHLGWKWETTSSGREPDSFLGLLTDSVESVQPDPDE
jgi:hypothetical protein